MKVRDAIKGLEDKDLIVPLKYRTIDKNGRLYMGVDHAHKKGLLIFIEVDEGK